MISAVMGAGLLGLLLIYIVSLYRGAQSESQGAKEASENVTENVLPGGLFLAVPVMIAGLIGLIWGADLMVTGAIQLARGFGISEAVIALSIVAVGTSLPELAVSVVASIRGQAGLAVGNIIGSNISNILLILGGTSLLAPLAISDVLANRDAWVMMSVAVLGVYFMSNHRTMSRLEGGLCLALYIAYIGFIYGA